MNVVDQHQLCYFFSRVLRKFMTFTIGFSRIFTNKMFRWFICLLIWDRGSFFNRHFVFVFCFGPFQWNSFTCFSNQLVYIFTWFLFLNYFLLTLNATLKFDSTPFFPRWSFFFSLFLSCSVDLAPANRVDSSNFSCFLEERESF